MLRVGSELRQKMEQLKSKQMADVEQNRRERPYNAKDDISDLNFRSGNRCNFYLYWNIKKKDG